jgi:hypothetical protein
MNEQILENTLKFLSRADLKWTEVPAFIECTNAIAAELKTCKKNKKN